ncbi:class I tRNA ligase family protein [Candidatus Hodgkinia cicadicola]|uniref:Isoleucine--tRNA ligase n=1 Tax=Candidatus Hodgkinia cicadicola TaxID=573658 RepID=A0ABX4MGQ1_9HYPH|nr:Isoleucine--tRNA ligase [Candidatus Hodgkinia cicadicola]
MFNINMLQKQENVIDVRYTCYQRSNSGCNFVGMLNRKRFRVLDGPPFANGELHLGHMVNKILKDICIKANEELGKSSSIKHNWDCHGLPIELQVIAKTKNRRYLSFLCKIYSLNWAITQALQHKMFGIRCYKSQTVELCTAQKMITDRIYNLVKTGIIMFGKKYSAWSITDNSSIPDIDITDSMVDSFEGEVCGVISKRRQVKITSTPTLLELLVNFFVPRFRMLGSRIQVRNCMLWSLPWGTYVNVSVNGLNFKRLEHGSILLLERNKYDQSWLYGPIPAEVMTTFNVFNVFNQRNMPIVVDFGTKTSIVDVTNKLNRFVRLTGYKRNFLTYNNKYFKKLTIDVITNCLVGQKHVINKLIACSLIHNCVEVNKRCLRSTRSNSLVINCVSPQWYIKLDYNKKMAIEKIINYIRFRPQWHKELIVKLIWTRADWIVSRQRVWGTPICLVRGKFNKILYDKNLFLRLWDLFEKEMGSYWSEIKILYDGYNRFNWSKVNDVLDVWFDAGMVYKLRNGRLPWDVVIEGVDQHRGWFQTLLIISTILEDKMPIRLLITHPFALNIDFKKMSKSIVGISVNEIINNDHNVSRGWVSGFGLSENRIIEGNWSLKMVEMLYRIDNVIKWALNVMEPEFELAPGLLRQIDRFILHKLVIWNNKIRYLYDNCLYYDILNLIGGICKDISSDYFELSKRILYCQFRYSAKRMNCLYVINCWTTQICKWLNPILPTRYKNIFDQLKIYNCVIWNLPSNWFNSMVALQFELINVIKGVVNEVLFDKDLIKNKLVVVTIIVSDVSKLKLFKNISSNDISESIKLNILYSKKIMESGDVEICGLVWIKIGVKYQNFCNRCRRLVNR